jgi:outer membrane immunogenic protein
MLAIVETGSAADLPGTPLNPPAVVPGFSWSGFYLGVEGGGGFGSSQKTFSTGTHTDDFKVDGAIAGGTVGYNKQWGSVVAGLEGDFSWSDVYGRTSCNKFFTCETNTTWLATVRPRVGYVLGNFMPYVTGGLAVGDVNVKSFLTSTGSGANGVDYTKTQAGWTAGAGIEMSIFSNWSLKAEYLYVRIPDTNGPSDNPPTTAVTSFYESIIRGGLNYTFK